MKDPRHRDCFLIEKGEITDRTFPEWSMGFKRLTKQDKENLEGFTEFLDKNLQPEEFANQRNVIVELLYQFKNNR